MNRRAKVNLLFTVALILWLVLLWFANGAIMYLIAYGCMGYLVGKLIDKGINKFIDKYWSEQ